MVLQAFFRLMTSLSSPATGAGNIIDLAQDSPLLPDPEPQVVRETRASYQDLQVCLLMTESLLNEEAKRREEQLVSLITTFSTPLNIYNAMSLDVAQSQVGSLLSIRTPHARQC